MASSCLLRTLGVYETAIDACYQEICDRAQPCQDQGTHKAAPPSPSAQLSEYNHMRSSAINEHATQRALMPSNTGALSRSGRNALVIVTVVTMLILSASVAMLAVSMTMWERPSTDIKPNTHVTHAPNDTAAAVPLALDCTSELSRQRFSTRILAGSDAQPVNVTALVISADQPCPEADLVIHVLGDVMVQLFQRPTSASSSITRQQNNVTLSRLESIGGVLFAPVSPYASASLTSIWAPMARSIAGINIGSQTLATFHFPALELIEGDAIIASASLTQVDLGGLVSVNGSLRLEVLEAADVNLRQLASVAGDLNIVSTGALPNVQMSSLGHVGREMCLPATNSFVDVATVFGGRAEGGTVAITTPWCVSRGHLSCRSQGTASSMDIRGDVGLGDFVTAITCERMVFDVVRISFEALVTLEGDVDLTVEAAHLDFGSLASIAGSLKIMSHSLSSIDFKSVTLISGDVDLAGNNLLSLDFGSITAIGGSVDVSNNRLTSIDFGNVRSIDGDLNADENDLTKVDFRSITRVAGDVSVHLNLRSLTAVDFGALRFIGNDLMLANNHLTSIDFGQITFIGRHVHLSYNDLTTIDFGPVTSIKGFLELAANDLQTVGFGAITSIGDDVNMEHNRLTNIDFGSITFIGGDLHLSENRLTNLDLSITQLVNIGGRFNVWGNRDLSYLNCNGLARGKDVILPDNTDSELVDCS